MTPERWRRIEEIFHLAVGQAKGQRDALLAECCGEDVELRREVESLLHSHENSDGLKSSAFDIVARVQPEPAPIAPGERIGRYTLRRLIGRGGSGVVYEAQQDNPTRVVALKLLRAMPALDELTPRLFQREAQALARLEHPGIATIHEAGQTDDRCYYFAMELVRGEPLTTHAATHQLSLRARLELFRRVCDAVQYAHQRGVIHRDLKPSNILVTQDGQPKVLDFGLARVIDPDADVTRVTEQGGFHGTLAYASPEHVSGRQDQLDVRTDVYALGVMLYEFATGRLPHRLDGLSFSGVVRLICEQPAPAPRTIDPALRGDLDTIILKALAKEPEQRYASAAAIASDLERFLTNQPILARAPNTWYVLGKFLVRHRVVSSLSLVLVLVIVGSAIAMSWLAYRFAHQRDLAVGAQREASKAQTTAEQFAGFLEDLFRNTDARATTAEEPSLRKVLDSGYAKLPTVEDPLVRARLMTVMGGVYDALTEHKRSRELLDGAIAIRREILGDDAPLLAESLMLLAGLFVNTREYDAADTAAAEALAIRSRAFGPDHALTAEAWEKRGIARYYANDQVTAVEHLRRALEIRRAVLTDPHPDVAATLANIGWALSSLRRLDEAESSFREALAIRQQLGDPAEIEKSLEGLGSVLVYKQDFASAEKLTAEELELARQVYHEHHPRLVVILRNHGFLVQRNHSAGQAEPLFREALAICRHNGNHGILLAQCLGDLADCLGRRQQRAEAVEVMQEAVELLTNLHGADHPASVKAARKLEALRTAK